MNSIGITLINFNHGHLIGRALDHICHNTIQPDELIIVDDGSNDDSKEVIDNYKDKFSFIKTIYLEHNLGSFKAGEIARSEINTTYMYCASADDYIDKTFIEKIKLSTKQYPNAGIVFSDMDIVDEKNKLIYRTKSQKLTPNSFIDGKTYLNDFLKIEQATHSHGAATVYKKRCFDLLGGLSSKVSAFRDTLLQRAIALKWGSVYLNEALVKWTKSKGSLSDKYNNSKGELRLTSENIYEIMTTEYKQYFPKEYADSWKKDYEKLHNL